MMVHCLNLRRNRVSGTARRGSFIIEAVIAAALLGTAVVALGKLAQTSSSLGVKSDARLSAKLTAENVIDRLHALPFDAIESRAGEVQNDMSKLTGWKVSIETASFDSGETDGLHVVVRVVSSENAAVGADNESSGAGGRLMITLHDWHFRGGKR